MLSVEAEWMYALYGFDAIPSQRFRAKLVSMSDLPYSVIGKFMKKYDRRVLTAAIIYANQFNRADDIAYIQSVLDKIMYYISARNTEIWRDINNA